MKAKVLVCVVDDDALIRESLSDLLHAAGYQAACFESTESFLASEHRGGCGCVVTDIHMTGLTGVDLVRRISTSPHPPKVILITGHAEESWRERALYCGADGFLRKPIESKTLLDLVERILAHDARPA